MFGLGLLIFSAALFWLSPVLAQGVDLGLQPVGQNIGLANTDIRVVVANIIRAALGLLGIAAVILIIYGGFIWMTAGGNEERIATAKKILLNASIGLIIILSAYGLVSFIMNQLIGATGGTGTGGPGEPYEPPILPPTSQGFYVTGLPSGGQLCINNVKPAVSFSQEVNLTTLNNGNLQLLKAGASVNGAWQYGRTRNTVIFIPTDSVCEAPDTHTDCLTPKTSYAVHFNKASAIKSITQSSLICPASHPCSDVVFVTGEGVDRENPSVKIINPADGSVFNASDDIVTHLNYADNFGVQKVELSLDGQYVGSKQMVGCDKNNQATITWNALRMASGTYELLATAYDWAAGIGEDRIKIKIWPAHCSDGVLDISAGEKEIGPPECGGECGTCGGGKCTTNWDCASGSRQDGICVNKMKITGFSPDKAGPGSYVSIFGQYFGQKPGHVYFAKVVKNPRIAATTTDWVEGFPVKCGGTFDSWVNNQIIVEVPKGAVLGPIMVVTDDITGKDGKTRKFIDVTNDLDWGPWLKDFDPSGGLRPGLCGIMPTQGKSGAPANLVGRNLGLQGSNLGANQVIFGSQNAQVQAWYDSGIETAVPFLDKGNVGVKAVSNGLESNSVLFSVEAGSSDNSPTIASISPVSGAPGEYITITGKNFGDNPGLVWFKLNGEGNAINGDFSFPAECKTAVWSDTRVIVKFPKDQPEGEYTVQVKNGNLVSSGDTKFTLRLGQPNPGLCNINPSSGPVPLGQNKSLELAGEYWGDHPEFYFWQTAAGMDSVAGRVKASDPVTLTALYGGGAKAVLLPPAETQTGPVVVHRQGEEDFVISNPLNFEVWDCIKNKGCSNTEMRCCLSGAEAGSCKPKGEMCAGETISTGYLWRFSTREIPPTPRVIERCNAAVDLGGPLPSPSPSIMWDQTPGESHHNVCRTASVVVEFSVDNLNKIPISDLEVYACEADKINTADYGCTAKIGGPIEMTSEQKKTGTDGKSYYIPASGSVSEGSATSFLELHPASGSWPDNTWYQVVLKKNISAGTGNNEIKLSSDRPCASDPDSAYCFAFRTSENPCLMKALVVTPYSFWTSVLESPMRYHKLDGSSEPVFYNGHGLSEQHCIMMDVSGFDWYWNSSRTDYSKVVSGTTSKSMVQVSAEANTVSVGLQNPDNALNIVASANTSTLSKPYVGTSKLTIDLSDPQVVDHWPACSQACTNAEIGVKFNASLSSANIPGAAVNGTIQLLQCKDENCLDTTSTPVNDQITFTQNSNRTELQIAGVKDGFELATDTIYKVIVSRDYEATPTIPAANPNVIWSAKSLNSPTSYSKPMKKSFSWVFKTKKERCVIDRVAVNPPQYVALTNKDRTVYNAQAFSAPDACSAQGQKINAWKYNWQWSTNLLLVATVNTFSTKGSNPYCTAGCVKRGSDIPSGVRSVPLCGNGVVEAGEDCDIAIAGETTSSCRLDCLRPGNPNKTTCGNGQVEPNLGETCDPGEMTSTTYCSAICLRLGSLQKESAPGTANSVCGNGKIGLGEACDLGIKADPAVAISSMNCNSKCLHTGSRVSASWCVNHRGDYGGYPSTTFDWACAQSLSQCGDGVRGPSEDESCDNIGGGKHAAFCNDYCLVDNTGGPASANLCTPGTEGCGANGQFLGSSLSYSVPSVCGDGLNVQGNAGIGENPDCEQNLKLTHSAGYIDPWTLVQGVGLGQPLDGTIPPSQQADIKAKTDREQGLGTVENTGKFIIPCGYQTDAECQAIDPGYGLAANSCCYPRANLVSTYPATHTPPLEGICPNTYLEAVFDKPIDPATLPNNVLIARGITSESQIKHVGSLTDGAGSAPYISEPRSVFVSGNYAYIASAGSNALEIVDITNPAKPVHKGSLRDSDVVGGAKLNTPTSVFVSGKYAYITSFNSNALEIVDISDPASPKHVSVLKDGEVTPGDGLNSGSNLGEPFSVFVSGNYAYIASAGNDSLEIVDISSSTRPMHKGAFAGANFRKPSSVFVSGKYAYVAGSQSNTLEIVDISDPTAPVHAGSLSDGGAVKLGHPSSVYVSGNYAYLTSFDSNALEIVDISDPTAPVHVAAISDGGDVKLHMPSSVYVDGGYAYVVGERTQALEVVDVTNPAAPLHADSIVDGGGSAPYLDSPRSVFVSGNYAYVMADTPGALEVIDISAAKKNCSAGGANDVSSLLSLNSSSAFINLPWYRKVWIRIALWVNDLLGRQAIAAVNFSALPKWCTNQDFGVPEVVNDVTTKQSHVTIKLNKPLATQTAYTVLFKPEVKDVSGVSVGNNVKWQFVTASQICEVDHVQVAPDQVKFYKANVTSSLEAKAFAKNEQWLQPLPGYYNWQYLWGPAVSDIFISAQSNTSQNTIQSQNRNGEGDAWATVNITENKYTATMGPVATGRSHVIVFLCENPWPPKDLFLKNALAPVDIFPYEDKVGNNDDYNGTVGFTNGPLLRANISNTLDGYFNFRSYYCADYGGTGVADDLPYLRPAVQPDTDQKTGSLKRFIFTNDKNADAIGIQVLKNPQHLTAGEWFTASSTGEIHSVKIGGYDAVTDGNNYYVDALNFDDKSKTFYSNIYLFSINADAQAETRQVFESFLNNLTFNINLTNDGYCQSPNQGAVMTNATSSITCHSDFDCAQGLVCSAQREKLQRDYRRLRDLYGMERILDLNPTSSLPILKEGTYLPGQVYSVWDTWSILGNALGGAMPVDPLNRLGRAGTCASTTKQVCLTDSDCKLITGQEACKLHDPTTGWSVEDRRFSFVCDPANSYAYSYAYSSQNQDYTLSYHSEDLGDPWQTALNTFANIFVGSVHVNTNLCPGVLTLKQAKCGDGEVSVGTEVCDPPGKKVYEDGCTAISGKFPNIVFGKKVQTCGSDCKEWVDSVVPCDAAAHCGNGIVEKQYGEVCDDGKALNGKYNHCNSDCDGFGAAGYCGDGKLQPEEVCDFSKFPGFISGWCTGVAKPGQACATNSDCAGGTCQNTKYNASQNLSCNWDCQSYGPFCGDGIVQADYGEQCEGDKKCTTYDGRTGVVACSNSKCKYENKPGAVVTNVPQGAVGWWKFDDALPPDGNNAVFFADATGHGHDFEYVAGSGGAGVPKLVDVGVNKKAWDTTGQDHLQINNPNVFNDSVFTVEFWIKPNAQTDLSAIINHIQQVPVNGNQFHYRGFSIAMQNDEKIWFTLYQDDIIDKNKSISTNIIPLSVWSHIVASFDGSQMKLFVNGVEVNHTDANLAVPYVPEKIIYDENSNEIMGINTIVAMNLNLNGGFSFFDGILDELAYYNRVLTDQEILAKSQLCYSTQPPVSSGASGSCGNGKVDTDEACDEGAKNGVVCQPVYNKKCTYCSGDCKNIVEVQPTAFCGDGVIQGTEKCENIPGQPDIFWFKRQSGLALTEDTNAKGYKVLSCNGQSEDLSMQPSIWYKGTRTCEACAALGGCITCGLATGADAADTVLVSGNIVNVLDPTSNNPLNGSIGNGGKLALYIGPPISGWETKNIVAHKYWSNLSSNDYLLNEGVFNNIDPAYIASNDICSNGQDPSYRMVINDDTDHNFLFPVFGKAVSGQYDLLLSPVMTTSTNDTIYHARIVVSWKNDLNFVAGFFGPNLTTLEDTSFTAGNGLATGSGYFTAAANRGIWFHTQTSTFDHVTAEAFSIDTTQLVDNEYAFYVRAPDAGMRNYLSNSDLKVEVYFPEKDSDSQHFARPARTFYLNQALGSDNPSAKFWYVFKLEKNPPDARTGLKPASASLLNISNANKFITSFFDERGNIINL